MNAVEPYDGSQLLIVSSNDMSLSQPLDAAKRS
jgi:hypothetical protein